MTALPMTALLSAALASTGCLSSTYAVPSDALRELAVTDPATRSRRVRVVQRFMTSEDPPSAPTVHVGVHYVWAPGVSGRARSGSVASAAAGGSARGGGPASGGASGGGQGSSASSSAEAAIVLVFVAAAASLGLAATEGVRYDGWAELHPLHPLHLWIPEQGWTWVPIAELTPELAQAAADAVIHREEGPFRAVGRAPLDRVGLTYGLELGGAGLDSVVADAPWGFMGRIMLGGFPIQELGLLGVLGLGWGANDDGETIFNARYGLEADVYPVTFGKVALGTYLEAGYAHSKEDTALGVTQSRTVPYVGGGALFQLDLTTRLALTLRAGAAALLAPEGTRALPEGSVGLAIY